MGLRIQNNVEAFNAHRQLTGTAAKAAKAMEKLSSGYRINRAADDAAGLAISEKMRGQIGGLAQAQRNAQDGVSLVQTAEGALTEVHSMLQRVRDLKVQYSNGTLDSEDKTAIAAEVKQLATEIDKIRDDTEFNGIKLLDGTGGTAGSVSFQVGANTGETISVTTKDITASATSAGMAALQNVASAATDAAASTAFAGVTLANIDDAIEKTSSLRAEFGAVQNRLEHRLNNLATYQENLVASESRIRDVDMASEMVNFTKLQILQQAGTSMLAQANQAPQSVLSLLR
jgi:flagellin